VNYDFLWLQSDGGINFYRCISRGNHSHLLEKEV
jgi:hypothetical protein